MTLANGIGLRHANGSAVRRLDGAGQISDGTHDGCGCPCSGGGEGTSCCYDGQCCYCSDAQMTFVVPAVTWQAGTTGAATAKYDSLVGTTLTLTYTATPFDGTIGPCPFEFQTDTFTMDSVWPPNTTSRYDGMLAKLIFQWWNDTGPQLYVGLLIFDTTLTPPQWVQVGSWMVFWLHSLGDYTYTCPGSTWSRSYSWQIGTGDYYGEDNAAATTVTRNHCCAVDASAWALSQSYVVGDYVVNGGLHYKCILNHTSTATDEPGLGANQSTYWTLTDPCRHVAGTDGICPGGV